MNREILRIALPSIITNITVPLLGLVDLAIVGHIGTDGTASFNSVGSAATIGAISVGTMIFNMVYWIFNFLRFGSSGLTAQAFGRKDTAGIQKVFRLAITVALACGLFVIVLQRPIEWLSGWIISPSAEVWTLAIEYFRIRVWAAPAVIMLFALNGWFVGMQNSRIPMYIAIGQNIVNIVASYLLVFEYNLGIAGVAIGTVIAQYVGLAAALFLWRLCYGNLFPDMFSNNSPSRLKQVPESFKTTPRVDFEGSEETFSTQVTLKKFFSVNRDIFLRMIFMLAVTCAFTSIGARMGDDVLAVNALLMQLFILFSYFSDGFALAGEALVGKYIGAKDPESTDKCIKLLFAWAGGVTIVFTLAYVFGIDIFLGFMTSDYSVIGFSQNYVGWAMLIPVASFAAFAWDGIYIGATATREMLYSLAISAAVFFVTFFGGTYLFYWFFFRDSSIEPPLLYVFGAFFANHILWFSFIAYLATRSIAQTVMAKNIFGMM